ncbi:ABC transporter ATP-binding protein [Thalassospira lucentensis]|uniref:ABC transporter ATP-binding protein n=1 Tax=Thalassospira lucentensis TaxID=168935 RepID=UPI00142D28F1|nr:ABC transporter ATP-binding protein [Thalassospira lucentensis]NIZ00145.1 ABC transporter ATP-binding protein [Thalassospira lucentensis]
MSKQETSPKSKHQSIFTLFSIWRRLTAIANVSKLQILLVASASTAAAFSEFFTIALIQPVIALFSGADLDRENLFFIQAKLVSKLEDLSSKERIIAILAMLLLLQILREVFLYLAEFQSIRIRTQFELNIRRLNYKKTLQIPISKFLSLSSGVTHSIINSYPRSAAGFVFSFISMIPTLTMLSVYIAMMINVEWRLFALVGVVSILIMLCMKAAYVHQTQFGQLMRQGLVETSTKANELIYALPVVRSFNQESSALHSYMKIASRFLKANELSAYLNAALGPLQRAISFILILGAMVVYYSVSEINELKFLSTLILFMFILTRINGPLTALNMQRAGLSQLQPTMTDLLDFLSTSNERTGGQEVKTIRNIRFNDVGFSYDSHEATIRNVSFSIERGDFIGIVGPSGAGKTTLINLLSSFETPTTGQILVDDTDLNKLELKSWRKQISIVPQKPYIFDLSIRENIRYGNPDASDAEVISAAKLANAHDFIERLQGGYNSLAGENGNSLSGGQVQRLAIARALLTKPEVLVLDEATSAQDTQSESKIKETIENLRGNMTIIVIAHRLSTIVDASRIYVLQSGEVVEQGTHRELMGINGLYQKLYELSVKKDNSIDAAKYSGALGEGDFK